MSMPDFSAIFLLLYNLDPVECGLFTSIPLSFLSALCNRSEHGPQNTASGFRLYRNQGYFSSQEMLNIRFLPRLKVDGKVLGGGM